MATTSLNLVHLAFSKTAPSCPSRQFPHHLPLKSQIDNRNLLVCKGKKNCYNVAVLIEEDEPVNEYVKIFEREVSRAGIPQEWRRRRFFESEKEELKRKAKDRFRFRRRRSGGSSKGRDDYGSDEDADADPTSARALAKMMSPDYEEGNIEVLDEEEFPDDVWDDDGEGSFPVPI